MHGPAQRVELIEEIFERRLGLRVDARDADLFAAGVLDSLSFINLLLHLESTFGVSIPLERLDLEQFSTIERIAAFVDGLATAADPTRPVALASGAG